jgi:hypothetical protein
MTVLTVVFGPAPGVAVEVHVASDGKPVQAKLTGVVKLLEVIKPTVVVPDMPGAVMVTLLGPETPVNPGWIVKVTGCVLKLDMKPLSPI